MKYTNGNCICSSSSNSGDDFGSFIFIFCMIRCRWSDGWNMPHIGLSKAKFFRKGLYGGGAISDLPNDCTKAWSSLLWYPRRSNSFVTSASISGGCSPAYRLSSNLVYGSLITTLSLWELFQR